MERRESPGRLERGFNLLYLQKGREKQSRKLPWNNFAKHRVYVVCGNFERKNKERDCGKGSEGERQKENVKCKKHI
jgi:hypothetical protein